KKSSPSSQPLRHGRKPIYPDSDAEAEGLDSTVDDEALETGLLADGEASPLLGHAQRRTGLLNHIKASWLGLWRDSDAKASARRKRAQRRTVSGASASSRRSSRNLANPRDGGGTWRRYQPIVMTMVYTLAALTVLVLLLLGFAAAHLFLSTLKSPDAEAQSKILDESLLLKGPDRLQLLNISDDGILVRVDARLGLDPDHALDIWLGKKGKQGWWKNKERDLIEWAVGKVGGVQIEVGEVTLAQNGAAWTEHVGLDSSYYRASDDEERQPQDLLAFHLAPLVLPLPALRAPRSIIGDESKPPILGNHSTPSARKNLNPLNLTILLKPVSPAPYILKFAEEAIEQGKVKLDVKVRSLRVRGLSGKELQGIGSTRKGSWFDIPRRIDISESFIRSPIKEKVPDLGNGTDSDELLKLDKYEFFEIGSDLKSSLGAMATRALGIKAVAQAKNPLGKTLKGQVDYRLPFGIYLPIASPANATDPEGGQPDSDESVLMAVVATEPFELTGEKKATLELLGRVVPPPKDSIPRLEEELEAGRGQLVFHNGPGAIKAQDGRQSERADVKGSEDTPQQVALSNFLSRFLRGDDNTVYVRGGSPFTATPATPGSTQSKRIANGSKGGQEPEVPQEPLPGGGSELPEWMESALRLVDLPISFPGSKVTELIKNVTIDDLKITPHPFEKDKLLCSGTVMGIMNLPGQLSTVDVKITHLWPDILVYDGLPPSMRKPGDGDDDDDGDDDEMRDGGDRTASTKPSKTDDDGRDGWRTSGKDKKEEPVPPLPSPLPSHAFARVRPRDFAPATTYPDPTDPTGETKLLRSELKDVPFTVLEGRGAIFRGFTWKILTGEGALAGIEGSSRAKIWNSGLGELQLRNLPVKGAFVVGKR
ncbi:hypothetical protein IE53DRAFT_300395, partial [Violaceomyces palustris]